jgi:hypothetical protein
MIERKLPDTRRGRAFRKMLAVLYVMSVAGMTLTVRGLVARWMDAGFDVGRLQAGFLLFNAVLLTGWGILCWTARRGSRDNLAPPSWVYAVVVLLSWAAIFLDRAGL